MTPTSKILAHDPQVITRPVLTINEEWCTPALFDIVLRWMYTQTIHSKTIAALDKTKRETYQAQRKLLLSVRRVAERFDIPGLVHACKVADDGLEPYL